MDTCTELRRDKDELEVSGVSLTFADCWWTLSSNSDPLSFTEDDTVALTLPSHLDVAITTGLWELRHLLEAEAGCDTHKEVCKSTSFEAKELPTLELLLSDNACLFTALVILFFNRLGGATIKSSPVPSNCLLSRLFLKADGTPGTDC